MRVLLVQLLALVGRGIGRAGCGCLVCRAAGWMPGREGAAPQLGGAGKAALLGSELCVCALI